MQKKKAWGGYRTKIKIYSYFKEVEKYKTDEFFKKPLKYNEYHYLLKDRYGDWGYDKFHQKSIKCWKNQSKKKKQWMK